MTRSMTPSPGTEALKILARTFPSAMAAGALCLVLSGLLYPAGTGAASAGEPQRQWPSSQYKSIEQDALPCTCRYYDKRYDIGESVCLKQAEGRKIAVCTMVINNPSWQVTDTPCPSAGLTPADKRQSGRKLAAVLPQTH
ncbi:hypothetical protein [Roseibium litorale]|uniref:Uncharacterized protein n=1 Tax=Roseibium litorale TaxID=2803841 RepID=A0ABR9CTH9_9HYPH|nr:hypothetical protein [Roseibium litorale]MBD8894173.1 hypothetical protein [Roseibium litorale]